MGCQISYSFHNVCIPASQVSAALAAIHALYHPETIERLGTAMIYDRTTDSLRKCYRGGHLPPEGGFTSLVEALRRWSLNAVQGSGGEVEIVGYRCDKAGDESALFDAIAPFLDYSYRPRVDAFQEDNQHWRHSFFEGRHRQVPGKVVYADEYPELFGRSS